MNIKALTDFNLGSMAANHRQGDILRVSEATGQELIAAGLAEAVKGDAPDDAAEKEGDAKVNAAAKARQTKPEAAVITHK